MKYCLVGTEYYDQAYGNKEILLKSNVINMTHDSMNDVVEHYLKHILTKPDVYVLLLEEIDNRHMQLIKKTKYTKEDFEKLLMLM
jgi:hypothetical protein